MNTRRTDLVGSRFGSLLVLEFSHSNARGQSFWACQCDCGNRITVAGDNLKRGNTSSCGCRKNALISQANSTHGQFGTRLYRIWADMKARCDNPKKRAYSRYGGKGIKYAPEWAEFAGFYIWAKASGYQDDLTIDRIDPEGNYCPQNCQWVTLSENSRRAREYDRRLNGL
jgi:hypothetical protein